MSALIRVFGFPTDAKLEQKSESVDCAALTLNTVGISTFLLSVIPAVLQTFGNKGGQVVFGFLNGFQLAFYR